MPEAAFGKRAGWLYFFYTNVRKAHRIADSNTGRHGDEVLASIIPFRPTEVHSMCYRNGQECNRQTGRKNQ